MTPYELFYKCEIASLDEFGARFSDCSTAFRLELLERYTEESEQPFFRQFKEGHAECPSDFNVEWLEILEAARKRGAQFTRARFVPPVPTDYMKFEIGWGFKRNIEAGEMILQFDQTILRSVPEALGMAIDYWLFDSLHCYLMIYDTEGRFLGVAKVPATETVPFMKLSARLISECKALPCS